MNWAEELLLPIPFEKAKQEINIENIQNFFPEVIENNLDPTTTITKLTVKIGKKNYHIALKELQKQLSTTQSDVLYQAKLKDMANIAISITLSAISENETRLVYAGSIELLETAPRPIKFAFKTMQKKIKQLAIEKPLETIRIRYLKYKY